MKLNKDQAKLLTHMTTPVLVEFIGSTTEHFSYGFRELFYAFVDGETIEWFDPAHNVWRCTPEIDFSFDPKEYRIKPKTTYININGYKVPQPVTSFNDYDTASYVSITSDFTQFITFKDYPMTSWWKSVVSSGIVHTAIKAARKHAEALLSFTNGQGVGSEWD